MLEIIFTNFSRQGYLDIKAVKEIFELFGEKPHDVDIESKQKLFDFNIYPFQIYSNSWDVKMKE